MEAAKCGICGGDGRIANSFGNTTRCPGCLGSGRRTDTVGIRDVTKTKPSHHQKPQVVPGVKNRQSPTTFEGMKLAAEVEASANLSSDTKAKLTREIAEHETLRGTCTQTLIKKIRKQVRPLA